MRRSALVIAIAVVEAGCGGRSLANRAGGDGAALDPADASLFVGGGADGGQGSDGASAADASVDVGTPVACDGASFIEVTDDSGTWTATDNCYDGGPPEFRVALCGEDYACANIVGCGGGQYVVIDTPTQFGVGTWPAHVLWGSADGGSYSVNASIRVTSFPASGGTLAGDYVGEVSATAAGLPPPHGAFCVQEGR
jgi:hypothetical protein